MNYIEELIDVIRKLHGSRMRSGKIVDIAANAIAKILIKSEQVKVKSWHDHTPPQGTLLNIRSNDTPNVAGED